MKILITGIGITGKSTFRKGLSTLLLDLGFQVESYDCDYDRDKLPNNFCNHVLYVIEDVHGPTAKAVIPLKSFDLAFYLLPGPFIHFRFWLSRMIVWFKTGKIAWESDTQKWRGTSQCYDLRNLPIIWNEFWRNLKNRKSWINEDLANIKTANVKMRIVLPVKKSNEIFFHL